MRSSASGSDLRSSRRSAFYCSLGSLRLAVEAGYLDLRDWPGRAQLQVALGRFFEKNETDEASTDITLVRRLHDRLANGTLAASEISWTRFAAFESYLELTIDVTGDKEVKAFLNGSHGLGQNDKEDAAFLLLPRHFADALATGLVGDVKATAASQGLKVLDCFMRFDEIQQRLRDESSLADDFIRHARWASNAYEVADRFANWTDAMDEWALEAGAEDEGVAEMRRAFARLAAAQHRLGLTANVLTEHVYVVPDTAVQWVEHAKSLLEEGRVIAAIQGLRRAAHEFDRKTRSVSAADWYDKAADLVTIAVRLAELGDIETAAAWVAPILPRLEREYSRGYQTTDDAVKIVALARQAAPPARDEGESSSETRTQSPTTRPAEQPSRYRPMGESE